MGLPARLRGGPGGGGIGLPLRLRACSVPAGWAGAVDAAALASSAPESPDAAVAGESAASGVGDGAAAGETWAGSWAAVVAAAASDGCWAGSALATAGSALATAGSALATAGSATGGGVGAGAAVTGSAGVMSAGLMAGGGGGMDLDGFAGASAVLPLEETTRLGLVDTGAGAGSSSGADGASAAGGEAACSEAVTFFSFLGGRFLVEITSPDGASPSLSLASPSSLDGGLMRPSRSALRRTRSAWASTMLEEWLFTPMPRAPQRSITSLLLRFSSRASS